MAVLSRLIKVSALVLGAGLVITGCGSVKMGAAAIVGDQRITVSSLDSQVSNLKTAAKPYASTMQLTAADYPAYQQAAIGDWKSLKQVPSCAHGSACSQGWQGAMNSAMGKFSTDGDAAALQAALVSAASQFSKK